MTSTTRPLIAIPQGFATWAALLEHVEDRDHADYRDLSVGELVEVYEDGRATTPAVDLAELDHVDSKPASNWRLGRCTNHAGDVAFTWKGGTARPACPLCGDSLANTTHLLKAGFYVLEGEDLARAERLPGGLARAAAWAREYARDNRNALDELEAKLAAGEAEEVHHPQYGRGIRTSHHITRYPAFTLGKVAKLEAQAARAEKRLARLGGELKLEAIR